jgi:hypothetical protein
VLTKNHCRRVLVVRVVRSRQAISCCASGLALQNVIPCTICCHFEFSRNLSSQEITVVHLYQFEIDVTLSITPFVHVVSLSIVRENATCSIASSTQVAFALLCIINQRSWGRISYSAIAQSRRITRGSFAPRMF